MSENEDTKNSVPAIAEAKLQEESSAEKREEEAKAGASSETTNKKEDEGAPPAVPAKALKAAFDDDAHHDHHDDDQAPPVPSRPSTKSADSVKLSPIDITIAELTEMFPETDLKYIKMALIASEGRLEPASNALLFLSDPSSGIEIPQPKISMKSHSSTQLQQDEELARKLAKSYEKRPKPRLPSHPKQVQEQQSQKQPHSDNVYAFGYEDSEDDDILENINKTVSDAKETIGGWFGNVAKKFQEAVDQTNRPPPNRTPSREYNDEQTYRPQARSRESNPYQTLPQEVQRGYPVNGREFENNMEEEHGPPRLPTRKQTKNLYSALGPSDHSLDDDDDHHHHQPALSSSVNEGAAKAHSTTSPSIAKITLTDADPEPSNDAFTVEDSEDEDEEKVGKS